MHGRLTEVRYAHPSGSNGNDGLTWGTAKKDVVSAYDALPAAGGDICVAPNTYMDSVNTDRGLWLLNPDDPSYNGSSPSLPGWRVGKPINLIGVGGGGHVSNAWERYPWGLGLGPAETTVVDRWRHRSLHLQEHRLWGVRGHGTTGRDFTMSGTINTACLGFDGCSFDSTAIFATGGPTIELGYLFWGRWAVRHQPGERHDNPRDVDRATERTTYRFSTGAVAHRLRVGDSFQIEA